MFDFIRDIGKPQAEKDREMLNAYVDGQLNAADARRMEEKIHADPALQAQVNQLLLLKQQLRALPHRRVPRSFVLDPTVYGAPERRPLSGAYPALRTATALTALLFVFVLGLSLVQGSVGGGQAPSAQVALFEAADEAVAEVAEAPLAAEAPMAEELSAASSAVVVEEEAMQEEALESAAAETLLVEPEAEAELALPADALDLNSTNTEDTAVAGASDSQAADEEAAKDLVPSEAEAAQADAAAVVEPRAGTERAAADEAAATATGTADWLPWVLLVLGLALLALLLMTILASRQNRV